MKDHNPALGLSCLILALVIIAMYVIANPARSQEQPPQMPCMPRALLEKAIQNKYGESTVGAGLNAAGAIYVMANPQTCTWTMIQLRPDNVACIISGGKGWVSLPPDIPGVSL